MKSIKELAPTWTRITEEEEHIPGVIEETINGELTPHIADPRCCFVGEARGGGCYYDTLIEDKSVPIDIHGRHTYIDNPDYCEPCAKMSMEFFWLAEHGLEQSKYKELCKKYEIHYNESHNGDKCKK